MSISCNPTAPYVKYGYLQKQARKSHRNWKKRWIVINLQQRVVSYYKTKKDFDRHKKPAGTFQLPPANETFVGPCSSSKHNSFEIYHIDRGTGKKTTLLALAADNLNIMDEWIEMLESVCRGNIIGDDQSGGHQDVSHVSFKEQRDSTTKSRVHAAQARQSIVEKIGNKRRSVAPSNLVNINKSTTQTVGQVEVVGAGTHEADGHYRTTRIGNDSNILAAYMSNTGYRLNLVSLGMKAKRAQWQIIEPINNALLYSVSFIVWALCMCLYMCLYICVCLCVCLSVCLSVYLCPCLCVCFFLLCLILSVQMYLIFPNSYLYFFSSVQ